MKEEEFKSATNRQKTPGQGQHEDHQGKQSNNPMPTSDLPSPLSRRWQLPDQKRQLRSEVRLNLRFKKFSKRPRALKALFSRGIKIIGRVDGDDETFSLYGTWLLQKSGRCLDFDSRGCWPRRGNTAEAHKPFHIKSGKHDEEDDKSDCLRRELTTLTLKQKTESKRLFLH